MTNPSVSTTLTGTDIISAVRGLAPEIVARGDEVAALRRLPADLVAKLKAAGVFRMAMPRAWGGPEMTPREQCEVYEILGAADASVAWCAKIGSDSGYFAAQLDEPAARTLFPDLDSVTAGQVLPTVSANESTAAIACPDTGRSAADRPTPT
jgi:alkylation response protein AidB-like acyl-CoA dehydrogenase